MQALMKLSSGIGHVGLAEVEEPTPGPGQVVVEVRRAGLCGTDIHIYDDEFKTNPPVVMGHEVSGVVAEVGEGVDTVRSGDRVTSETYFSVCGRCPSCRSGAVNLCSSRRSIGSAVNGAFAKYLLVPAQNLHLLPDSVSFEAGALTEPVACCVHGVSLNHIVPGDLAVVAGPGAIGLITAQLAKAAGAKVVLLGTGHDEKRLELGLELGVDRAINIEETDPVEAVRAINPPGADVVFECSGAGPAAELLFDLIRPQGRYSQVGLFGRPISLDIDQICYKEITVTGSNASVPWAWKRAIQLIGSGLVQTAPLVTHLYRLDQWEEAFQRFRAKEGVKHMFAF